MARDAQSIQAEIERARDALAVAVDEITTRGNPKRLVAQGKQQARAFIGDPKVKYSLIAVGALVGLVVLRKLFR